MALEIAVSRVESPQLAEGGREVERGREVGGRGGRGGERRDKREGEMEGERGGEK